jgi:uncharacterized MAPEG superfamily protein
MDIAIWCLIATFFLIYAPRLPAIQDALRQEGHIDLAHPRLQQARLTGRGARAQAAHLNTVEAFAPFAAALWVSYHYGVDAGLRDGLAITFVIARVLFIGAYLADLNPWRTVVWSVGHLAILGLFLAPLL